MKKYTILIADDEQAQRLVLAGHLKQSGYEVLEADCGIAALEIASKNLIDVVLSDFKMPDITGLELLKKIRSENPETSVVIITAFGTIETAVEAMKEGAYDYLTKPVDLDELDLILRKIIERNQLISENKLMKNQLSGQNKLVDVIARSKNMENVLNIASRVSDSKATVLIRGESGTGKEILARAIHYSGNRKDKPFVAVNCAALNENLLESELFGHEKGAFTGAEKQRRGRFEIADEGTLFLDEIGDLPIPTQIKLLRFLQEEQFERVGGNQTISVNVRIIAATNRNIETLISDGKFREDLLYRINVVTINIPPLKERKEDIISLIEYFINKYLPDTKKEKAEFSREATDLLLKYSYPGNVRELENIIHHSIVLSRNELITAEDLPSVLRSRMSEAGSIADDSSLTMTEQVDNLEKKLVFAALEKMGKNQTRAAEMLGISERNLRYRLEKWGYKK